MPAPVDNGSGGSGGAWMLGIICTGLIGVAVLTSGPSSTDAINSSEPASAPVAQPATEPVLPEPVNVASVARGGDHFRLAYAAEGAAAAMIYSQNCYDALGRHFSWSKLDLCGAFDVRGAQELADTSGTEADYFQSESAATRYLTAAIKGGEQPDSADQRLAAIQSRIKPRIVSAMNRDTESVEVAEANAEADAANEAAPDDAGAANDLTEEEVQ